MFESHSDTHSDEEFYSLKLAIMATITCVKKCYFNRCCCCHCGIVSTEMPKHMQQGNAAGM